MADIQKIEDFLKVIQLGVVSTIGPGGEPQSAVVGLTRIAQSDEILIGTSIKSRKYTNIKKSPRCSITVWHDKTTIQLEGNAEILERDTGQFADYQSKILEIHPEKAKYADDPDQIWIVFKPKWLRYTNTGTYPWEIIEQNK